MSQPTTQPSCLLLGLLAVAATAQSTGRPGYGLIGYGIEMYNPPCAYACHDQAVGFMFDCGADVLSDDSSDMSMAGMTMTTPAPKCYAENDLFLQTLAWCIHTHCDDSVPVSKIESYWETDVVGRELDQPQPKYSYQVALSRVTTPPTAVADVTVNLNSTSLVDEDGYLSSFNGNYYFERSEIVTERYAIILMSTCLLIPIALSWVRFLPLPQSLVARFYGWFIDPPVFGKYHSTPVLGLGFVPTRGQALFIVYIWVVNVALSAVDYIVTDPNSWFSSPLEQMEEYAGNRVGVFSFVNLALAVLFSSRNNVLLWLTNWSHGTFLLLHRWVAVIAMLQAVVHSALYLDMYMRKGGTAYDDALALPFWTWGIIGTVTMAALVPLSVLPLRKRFYEVFLASHIVLSLLAMVGCFLHIIYRYQWQWGYQTWVLVSFAIWGFERFLARPVRLARNGVKRAYVTAVDEDYLRVDIPGVDAHGQAYLYFPTLTWRVWENHPFSVATISGPRRKDKDSEEPSSPGGSQTNEKTGPSTSVSGVTNNDGRRSGVVFYIRRGGGLTAALASHGADGLSVLVEASYGSDQMSVCPAPHPRPTVAYPNVVCIAGGVGITAVLPLLNKEPNFGTTKLFWGVRTEPLVRSVEDLLGFNGSFVSSGRRTRWGHVDVTVSVKDRFDLRSVLEEEIKENKESGGGGGTTVIVCGPVGMADDVRVTVAALARNGASVRLVEESFGW